MCRFHYCFPGCHSSAGIIHGIDVAEEIAHIVGGGATAAAATARIIRPQKTVHRIPGASTAAGAHGNFLTTNVV